MAELAPASLSWVSWVSALRASLGVMMSPAHPRLLGTSSSQTYTCVSYTLVCYFKKGQMKKTLELRHKFQDCRCLQATWGGVAWGVAGCLVVGVQRRVRCKGVSKNCAAEILALNSH